jgi:carbon-monoxide dehydrogenase large subunit
LLDYDQYPLASDRVRYVGEPLAVVLASNAYTSEDAADAVNVDYEPLHPVTSIASALCGETLLHPELGTNILYERAQNLEDVGEAISRSPVQVEHTFRYSRQAVVPLEGRGVMASYDDLQGTVIVVTSTQAPHLVRTAIAETLGLLEEQVRVIRPDVGGGFGSKSHTYGEELALAYLAYHLRESVAWVEDRRENLTSSIHAHETEIKLRLGASVSGELQAVSMDLLADSGAHSVRSSGASLEAATSVPTLFGPYRVPQMGFRVRGVVTNKTTAGAYRGVGVVPTTFATERMMDMLAAKIGVDAAVVRQRNLLSATDLPFTAANGQYHESGNYLATFNAVLDRAGYKPRVERSQTLDGNGRKVGVGMACVLKFCALGSWFFKTRHEVGFDGAKIRVSQDGTVHVYLPSASSGQGHDFAYGNLVARLLGVLPERVRVVEGDTALVPLGTGTFNSRTAIVVGASVHLACEELLQKAKLIAAQILKVEGPVEIAQGWAFASADPERRIPFEAVARAAHVGLADVALPAGMEPGLETTRYFDPPYTILTSAAHVATVEVDTETGQVKLLNYFTSEDAGAVIDEKIVEEQVVGATAMGIGNALYEEVIYDETGQLLSGSLMDYLVPTADNVPEIEVVHLSTPTSLPGGYRGAGESGTVGAPAAIANAVADALESEAGAVDHIPITPARVLRSMGKVK